MTLPLTGRKHNREENSPPSPESKKPHTNALTHTNAQAHSSAQPIDYKKGCKILKLAQQNLSMLRSSGLIQSYEQEAWMQNLIKALQPDLSIQMQKCHEIAKQIWGVLSKTPIRQNNQGLFDETLFSEFLTRSRDLCTFYQEDFANALEALCQNKVSILTTLKALRPFIANKKGLVSESDLLSDLLQFFHKAPDLAKQDRIRNNLLKLLPTLLEQLVSLNNDAIFHTSLKSHYQQLMCLLRPFEVNFEEKLVVWNRDTKLSLREIPLFVPHIAAQETKPGAFSILLQACEANPGILNHASIRHYLQKLIEKLWEEVKSAPYFDPACLFKELNSGYRILLQCDPSYLSRNTELVFADQTKLTLNYACTEALAALSAPFAQMLLESKKPERQHQISLIYTHDEFLTFYKVLSGEEPFDLSSMMAYLTPAEYFSCDSLIDHCFQQLRDCLPFKNLRWKNAGMKVIHEALHMLCALNQMFAQLSCSTDTTAKWEQTRDEVFSALLSNINAKNIDRAMPKMLKMLQADRKIAIRWPRTLYISSQESYLFFQKAEFLLDHVEEINVLLGDLSILQRAPNLRRLSLGSLLCPFSTLLQYCPRLETLRVCSRAFPFLMEFAGHNHALSHLRELTVSNKGILLPDAGVDLRLLRSPFCKAMPNLETFHFQLSLDLPNNRTVECIVNKSQGSVILYCDKDMIALIQKKPLLAAAVKKAFPFVNEILFHLPQESDPLRFSLVWQGEHDARLLPFA